MGIFNKQSETVWVLMVLRPKGVKDVKQQGSKMVTNEGTPVGVNVRGPMTHGGVSVLTQPSRIRLKVDPIFRVYMWVMD